MDAAGDFYREWRRRRPGATRSVRRAALLARRIGADPAGTPVLTVVGSKGKGTAATYASAYLAASGLRVVTVTSPALRSETDRVRVDGAAVSGETLAALGRRLREAAAGLPAGDDGRDGYLSPSGLYLMAGVLHAEAVGADVLVLEAGMGGASDEVSLFPPTVLAITEVFEEHVGVLGDTAAEIAADKAGVAAPATAAVVSLPQSPPVTEAIAATVAGRTRGRVRPEVVGPGASGVPGRLLPAGPARMNAELGCAAARRLLEATGGPRPGADRQARVLSSVILPGRCSCHPVPGTGTTVLVDSAINGAGAAAALREAYRRWGRVDHVVVCLPDHKDVAGAARALTGLPVTYVRLTEYPRLGFTGPVPAHWTVMDTGALTRERLASLGERVVVLGTGYFTGRILDMLDADTRHLFKL